LRHDKEVTVKVSDAMTLDVAWVKPETSLKEVAELLAWHEISGVPVCAPEGVVLGVVSEQDILAKEAEQPDRRGAAHADRTRLAALAKHAARTAEEAMTAPAVTIAPECTLTEAARRMLAHKVSRLPVVHEGRLVGIVTRADLVRAFARSDAELEHEIVADVLARVLCLEPGRVAVRVRGGEVRLTGEVESRSDARLLEQLVRRVPGVVSVEARLTWRFDDLIRTPAGPTSAALAGTHRTGP
jgi:CBS domain-containing protein